MNKNYHIEILSPFGIKITAKNQNTDISQFSTEQIKKWIHTYQVVVFRGFKTIAKQPFALYAQKLGEPIQWPFGAINDLIVKTDTENYIYTNHKVPFHWDGAFVNKIPHIILFQCIKAPPALSKGGTTFCNTIKLLENIDAEKLEQWSQISITYKTEKKVHYGGQFTQKLIDKHPISKKAILRYAEPVQDLNPVSLEISELKDSNQSDFVESMKKVLYQKDVLYTHQWKDGDFVMADNFALLHGREAFIGDNSRYIQRINLLERPSKLTLSRFIKHALTIRRKEFFKAEIPILILPVLLSLQSFSDIIRWPFVLGFIAIFLLFNLGDMINCYADRKLDAIYKSHLSNAVFELGKRQVMAQIVLSGILAMTLTIFVAVQTHQVFLIPLTFVGILLGLQYSIPPFKFKSKGIWQFFCLLGIIFLGPMLYTSIITNGLPKTNILLFFLLYGIHQMGIILFNTAEDYIEDKTDGINTIVVQLGLQSTLKLAWYCILFSGSFLHYIFYDLLNQLQVHTAWFTLIGIFTLGWLTVLKETQTILTKTQGLNNKETTDILKKNGMKVPRWLNIGAYSILTVIGLYILIKFNINHG